MVKFSLQLDTYTYRQTPKTLNFAIHYLLITSRNSMSSEFFPFNIQLKTLRLRELRKKVLFRHPTSDF